jgi:transcriptional regulator with XRE-family HTH domain
MRARFRSMTLQTLLRQHGITTIKELTHRTELSRQQSWNLWHGYAGVGKETAIRLHERLGIPLEALLKVEAVRQPRAPACRRPRQPPKGRPSTPPKEQP